MSPSAVTEVRRDVGQLLWIGFEGTSIDEALRWRLAEGEAGAVVLFRRNLPAIDGRSCEEGAALDAGALLALNDELHAVGASSGEALLIAVDQEGGLVQRVRRPATRWPPMMSFDRIADGRDVELAREVGTAMGCELAALGFDVDFAPVLDIHTNDQNPIIGDRAFGRDPDLVARRALAFAEGLADAGVLACGKHYPGHGDTDVDSHLELPRLSHDLERLRRVELVPFARAAAAGLPMVMTAHVVFEAIDPGVPATLSRRALGDILRGELGYRGLVVSDDLDMKAIASHIGVADAAVRSVAAGCDALLLCRDRANQEEALEALIRSCERDSGFRARVAVAAAAVRVLKDRLAARPPRPPLSVLGSRDDLARELAPG
jgi:beta-N-acetylhexosaminidase